MILKGIKSAAPDTMKPPVVCCAHGDTLGDPGSLPAVAVEPGRDCAGRAEAGVERPGAQVGIRLKEKIAKLEKHTDVAFG